MKVIHLNTYDGNGGAGRACLRLNKALRDNGVQSEVWVGFKFSKDPAVNTFAANMITRSLTAFGILLERFLSSAIIKKLKIPFSLPVWGRDISNHQTVLDADIIHIHWVNHGFLRPRDLQKLKRLNKPVVWTFHDSNAFTGGCHVRYSCDHFERECGNCPLLKNEGPNDWSHRVWLDKQAAYHGFDFAVIAPSKWMQASVRRSKLLSDRIIFNVPNTLDTKVFGPVNKSEAKQKLDLPKDVFIILSGFMPSRNDLHKGTPYLLESLELLCAMIPKEKIRLVVFGNRDEKNAPVFAVETIFLGTISSDERLALCYSAADVFVTPSLEDNLPNTVMESLSCGTPVVAFTTGGIPDMVTHLVNGYLAEYKSAEALAAGIRWVHDHPERDMLSRAARKLTLDNFSEAVIAEKHREVYRKLIPIS